MKSRELLTYLALGDSYTIGESVPVYESFPYQTIQLLRKAGYSFAAAEIVAKTGWTTGELQQGIQHTIFQPSYQLVSLLIGVNNQYRASGAELYAVDFESLLQQAIGFAGNQVKRVFVLSIPDWGITPFATGKDRTAISSDINQYNKYNKKIAGKYQVNYLDITAGSREAAQDESLLAADKLHPSSKEYARWAQKLADAALIQL
jgi:lysophospholipase L1-like esterase